MQNPAVETQVVVQQAAPTAAQMYQAARAHRQVLDRQMNSLENQRNSVTSELTNERTVGADRTGLETRLKELDARILDMDKQIAAADANQAKAASVPGAMYEPPPPRRNGPPEEAYAFGAFATMVVVFPFVIAYSRRIWRRSAKVVVTLPQEVSDRMQAMEEAIESVAVEVERIGEGQRFMTQALAEGGPRQLGVGAADPIAMRQRETVAAERRI